MLCENISLWRRRVGHYLAHVLARGGNEVTVLARGKRYEELTKDGIVIRHYFQRKTTVDKVRVIHHLSSEELYDLIFVVMKYNDFPLVLPILAQNQSSHIVLVGNNADAHEMQNDLQKNSAVKKNIAFGFQLSGGRREVDRMICIRGGGHMVLGSLEGELSFKPLLEKAFEKVKYKLDYQEDMDAWLKSHIVPILAMNAISITSDNQFKKMAKNKKLLMQMITAIDEGFKVLESLGYTIIPANQVKFIRNYRGMVYSFLKIYHMSPITKLIDGSPYEIAALMNKFTILKQKSNVMTPHLDEIAQQFNTKFAEIAKQN
ncbi:ketopantoate reductase family protein [Paenibacillus sp. MCAF9]|uniref:ketopantoate reductase family protein n=1 Tax=Paenibacillus sp. MCAF9 TaxID=3233046 RepID=UPI003F96F521